MVDKSNTVLIDRYKFEDVSDLLNEVLRRIETFNRYNGFCAPRILMNAKQYLAIREERPDVLTTADDSIYILCTKIII